MRKSRMQKLAIAWIAAFAVLGGIGAANAQMHGGGGGVHDGGGFNGGSGFHGGSGPHGNGGFHGGGGVHGGGGFHGGGFHGHSHRDFFIGAPIILAPGYPYGYSYPYGDAPYGFYGDPDGAGVEPQANYYWYCPDPAGYYPDVQACPSGWLQVVPNG